MPEKEPTLQEVIQAAQQAAQAASQAAQAATQSAQQIAEQVGQAVSQAIQKFITTAGLTSTTIRETDIGEGERATLENLDNAGILFSNKKRTFDEYQNVGLESIKHNQALIDQSMKTLQQQLAAVNNITISHLQNATTTANTVNTNAAENANLIAKETIKNADNLSKQHTAHRDIATDRIWNVDEANFVVSEILRTNTFKDAVAAAVAEAVNELKPKTA
jgi:hypothetical protein